MESHTHAIQKPTEAVGGGAAHTLKPRTDILESDAEFYFVVDMPGVTEETVDLSVQASTLLIRGTRKNEPMTTYEREFQLSPGANPEDISAAIEGGILRVHVGKTESARPRTIPVQGARQTN